MNDQTTATGKMKVSTSANTLNNVWNFIGGSLGFQGHEKALKNALYNALAMLLLVACSAAMYALFFILEPFIKPLIWALLLGSVLHPFKYSLVSTVRNWLNDVEAKTTPLTLAFVMIPIQAFDRLSDNVGNFFYSNLKKIFILGITIPTLILIYKYTPQTCLCVLWRIIYTSHNIVDSFVSTISTSVATAVILGYVGAVFVWWRPETSNRFSSLGVFIWILIAAYLSRFVGPSYQIIAFFTLQIFYGVGFLYTVWTDENKIGDVKERRVSLVEALIKHTGGPPNHEDFAKPKDVSDDSLDSSCLSETISSDRCIYAVAWTCLAVFVWNHFWLIHFLPITLLTYAIKNLGQYFNMWKWIGDKYDAFTSLITNWCVERQSALCPRFVIGGYKLSTMAQKYTLVTLKDSADAAASVLVILGLLVFVICTTIFISVNIYAEGIHLVQVGGNIINSTVSNNQDVLGLLPENIQDTLHSVLENAYQYGRQTISNMVKAMLKNVEESKAGELEERVLELWDRVYQAWMSSVDATGPGGPQVPPSAVYASWENFVDGVQKTPELLNLDGLMQFAKENVGTLSSLLESLWEILKGNISLVFYSVVTLFSVVLGGGSAVINFLVNSVVFFTALFYLLSSSGGLYRPVEMVTNFSPSSGNQVAVAIESAVGNVFRASFKLAVFHGLWAWLVHTLFQVKVVYLPSVLAAILGVVPFLGTYWACLPAILELWLAQGQGMLAFVMLLAYAIPTSWVNGLVYEEIKGGHPYLTGLSIAGGVYCLGSEGAIFGPLLLCCVFVALNISSTLMKEPSVPNLASVGMLTSERDT